MNGVRPHQPDLEGAARDQTGAPGEGEREGAAAASGGNTMDTLVDRLFEQAQILYRRWPEVEDTCAPAPREQVPR